MNSCVLIKNRRAVENFGFPIGTRLFACLIFTAVAAVIAVSAVAVRAAPIAVARARAAIFIFLFKIFISRYFARFVRCANLLAPRK